MNDKTILFGHVALLHLSKILTIKTLKPTTKKPTDSRWKARKPMALTPLSSFINGADSFSHGECTLLRIPMRLNLSTDTDHDAGLPLPPTSGGNSSQHFVFIRSFVLLESGSYEVVAYPVISFSNQGGAVAGYTALAPAQQACLIPLPPLSSQYTPPAFGNPINLGGFAFSQPLWLLIIPHRFIMPENQVVS